MSGRPDAWGMRVRLPLGRHQTLLAAVRDYLFRRVRQGVLREDNNGRGHISGSRFRPVSVDLSPAEKKTAKDKAEGRGPKKYVCHILAEETLTVGDRTITRKNSVCKCVRRRPGQIVLRPKPITYAALGANPLYVSCKKCLASDHPLAVAAKEMREVFGEVRTYEWESTDWRVGADKAEELGKLAAATAMRARADEMDARAEKLAKNYEE